jgi:hypothetical protein
MRERNDREARSFRHLRRAARRHAACDLISTFMGPRAAAAVLAALVVLATATARPSATSPTLVVSAVNGMRADGRVAVTVEGTFDFPNAVQVGYPLQLVVFQGTGFVRFPIGGTPQAGQSSLLADGRIDPGDVPGLLAAGSPTPADVRIVSLSSARAVLALPGDFQAGAATVQAFADLADGRVLSNPLALVLP